MNKQEADKTQNYNAKMTVLWMAHKWQGSYYKREVTRCTVTTMLWGRLGALEVLVHRQALCLEPGSVTVYRPLLSPSCLLPGLLGKLPDAFLTQPDSFTVVTSPTFGTLPFFRVPLNSTLHACVMAICLSLLDRQHLRAQKNPNSLCITALL